MRSQSVSEAGEAASTGPLQRLAASAASPFSRAFDPDEADAHRKAALRQITRGDKTVAPIVTRSRHNRHTPALQRSRSIGHRATRTLHQINAWNAAGNRQPIGLRHFCCGEKLEHCSQPYRPAGTPTIRAVWPRRNTTSDGWQKFLQGA